MPSPIATSPAVTVVCVKAGPKYSSRYVNILYDMVCRHLSIPHAFVCATDSPTGIRSDITTVNLGEPQLKGWWHKLQLFKPHSHEHPHPWGLADRLLFLDLDIVIVGEWGSLDSIALHRPDCDFLMCKDFVFPLTMNNSSVMLLTTGSRPEIWRQFSIAHVGWEKRVHGDQEFIHALWPDVETLPEGWVVSYRLQAKSKPPVGSKIVAFHGYPKPDQIRQGWVLESWRENSSRRESSGTRLKSALDREPVGAI